jgi:putative lipoic acid-binding regulatory protein
MRDIEDIKPAEGQGFQFPGEFEITAMGNAAAHLETLVPELLQSLELKVLHETVSTKQSSGGSYVSVTVAFECPSREKYDEAHAKLREHPEIRFTL